MKIKTKNCVPYGSIKNALRKLWLISSERKLALNRAKQKITIGLHKNGKPKYKTVYRCSKCNQVFDIKQVNIHHVIPVNVAPLDWNTQINRLFCDADRLICVCIPCHEQIHNFKEKEKQ